EDGDDDEWADALDNCPSDANPDQADLDGDLIGDVCNVDIDNDGFANDLLASVSTSIVYHNQFGVFVRLIECRLYRLLYKIGLIVAKTDD
ncbi:MAG: thrombospondin type 3 repeat-containing protein, partial [Ekhidna sp.]|nr:thrombospondin type 3 repeat-containing protein [Ekhidna sp.]